MKLIIQSVLTTQVKLAACVVVIMIFLCALSSKVFASDYIDSNTPDYDLNGDGTLDPISIEYVGDKYGYDGTYYLVVAGCKYKGRVVALYGEFEVVDLDTTDQYREIAISEVGHSNLKKTHLLWYDGQDIHYMGEIAGIDPTFDNAGGIHSSRRGSVLHTWHYPADYRITSARTIEFVEQDLYPMNSHVVLSRDLQLYVQRSETRIACIVVAGQNATIVASDDKAWCMLETVTGQRGWFRCGCSRVGGSEAHLVFAGWRSDSWVAELMVTLKKDVQLYSQQDFSVLGVAFNGWTGTLHRTADKDWLEFRSSTGTSGLVYCCADNIIGGIRSDSVFEGLNLGE